MLSMWKIKFNPDDWSSSTCSCPIFQKQYFCKHWIGVALKKKVLIPTLNCTEISVKPPHGRPKERDLELSQLVPIQPEATVTQTKRGPGRPPKARAGLAVDIPQPPKTPTKRGRGRPFKPRPQPTSPKKRGRGRPPKRPVSPAPSDTLAQPPTKGARQP